MMKLLPAAAVLVFASGCATNNTVDAAMAGITANLQSADQAKENAVAAQATAANAQATADQALATANAANASAQEASEKVDRAMQR